MGNKWVDFKEIKEKVGMEMLLSRYGLLDKMKQSSRGLRGPCPIHKGTHPNQFHVDPVKNRWNCFGGCDMQKLEGHVIGFVAAMEGVSLRDAALLIAEWYGIGSKPPSPKDQPGADREEPAQKGGSKPNTSSQTTAPKEAVEPSAVNPEEPENEPLTFELKSVSKDHPFFLERLISPATVEYFGLGFCSKGMMKNRIVFPLHRRDGQLIGYTGRTVLEITNENPKWILPPNLVKPKMLLNFHRVAGKFETVILVEGPWSLTAVFQAGFPNVCALLGREILADDNFSYDQFRLIADNFEQVVLLLDGDKDGREAAQRATLKLAPHVFVRALTLPDDKDPADFTSRELQAFLSFLK